MAKQVDYFAFIFNGVIFVDEVEIFVLTKSDAGNVIYINNKKVVDSDEPHTAISRIILNQGYHTCKRLYFDALSRRKP